jgi:hypothetical protein
MAGKRRVFGPAFKAKVALGGGQVSGKFGILMWTL